MNNKKILLGDKKFQPFFWTQFLGALNDNLFKTSMVLLISYVLISAPANADFFITLATGIFILPFFIFSPVAGQLADSMAKDLLIRRIKLSEILIMLVGTLALYLENIYFLLAVLFLMGTQSAFFGPVKYSVIPDIVKEDDIVEANAYVEAGTFLAILIGTVLAGFAHNAGFIWMVSGVLIFAGLGYLFSRKIPRISIGEAKVSIEWNPLPTYLNLLAILRQKKVLFHSVIGISWFWLVGALVLTLFPGFVKNDLRGDETCLTLLLASFTLGIGAGSFLFHKLSKKKVALKWIPIGSFLMSLFLALVCFLPEIRQTPESFLTWRELLQGMGLLYFACFFFVALFGGLYIVPLYSLLQIRADRATCSRVMSANNIMNSFFMVAGSLALMLLLRLDFSYRDLFLVLAISTFVVSFYICKLGRSSNNMK